MIHHDVRGKNIDGPDQTKPPVRSRDSGFLRAELGVCHSLNETFCDALIEESGKVDTRCSRHRSVEVNCRDMGVPRVQSEASSHV